EPLAADALGQGLRLELVVLLELEVLHRGAGRELDTAPLVALEQQRPGVDDLRALEERRVVEDDHVEVRGLEGLAELAHEVHLVVEVLGRLDLVEQEQADVEIAEAARELARGGGAARVRDVDRRGLEELRELGLLLEEIHLSY